MDKISDELRKKAKRVRNSKVSTYRSPSEYERLADRIDQEMVELPKDADGVPIRVGDMVYLDDGEKAKVTRVGIRMIKDNIYIIVYGEHFSLTPEHITHTRPDSFVHIADELDEWCDSADADTNTFDVPRDLAKRIRELAAKEDQR